MSNITIRLNKEEEAIFRKYNKIYKGGLSTMIKQLALEKLEDEYDLMAVAEYEKLKKENKLKLRPIEELFDELGIDYE